MNVPIRSLAVGRRFADDGVRLGEGWKAAAGDALHTLEVSTPSAKRCIRLVAGEFSSQLIHRKPFVKESLY